MSLVKNKILTNMIKVIIFFQIKNIFTDNIYYLI